MTGEIKQEEIEKYISTLKNQKAPGVDEIPNEFIKYGGKKLATALTSLYNKILFSKEIPVEWGECTIKLIHKGNNKNKNDIRNYRPISLQTSMSKIFCGIINSRINRYIEENRIIGEEQNGFRENRSGIDNIYTLNNIIENKARSKSKIIATLFWI